MLTYLRRLVDERTSLTEIATRMTDAAAEADRDLSDDERTQITNMQTRCAALDDQIRTFNDTAASDRAYAGMLAGMGDDGDGPSPTSRGALQRREPSAIETLQAWLTSDDVRGYPGRGTSSLYEAQGFTSVLQTRAPITTSQLAIQPYVWAPLDHVESFPLLDLISHVQVSSGVVQWTEIGPAPMAAVVAEATAKPEAALVFTPHTSALETLAHWIQITRQALEDATYMQSLIETKLRSGLFKKMEYDVAAAILTATLPPATGADLMSAIRVGVGVVEEAGYNPNAVLLNPADYAALDIAAAAQAQSGPTKTATFWGLRPVAIKDVPAGQAFVGDFPAGVTMFDRSSTSVFLTDSHQDLFIKNILVILAEARVKSAVTDPAALANCTVTP